MLFPFFLSFAVEEGLIPSSEIFARKNTLLWEEKCVTFQAVLSVFVVTGLICLELKLKSLQEI